MRDDDRWPRGETRERNLGRRDERGYDADRRYGGRDRPSLFGRENRENDDDRGRRPGATDMAFGRGFGSDYEGRDQSGRGRNNAGGDYYSGFYGADQGYGDRGRDDRADAYRDRDDRRGGSYDAGMYGQGGYGRGGSRDESYGRRRGEPDVTGYRGERGYLERAGDEIASWFGDDDASHRRRQDAREGDEGAQHHGGRGPRNYQRSDERIRDDVNDRLTDDRVVDASEIEVSVQDREVTLNGSVGTRYEKRRAEDVADGISGVTHVQNNLRVRQAPDASAPSGRTASTQAGGTTGQTTGQAGTTPEIADRTKTGL